VTRSLRLERIAAGVTDRRYLARPLLAETGWRINFGSLSNGLLIESCHGATCQPESSTVVEFPRLTGRFCAMFRGI